MKKMNNEKLSLKELEKKAYRSTFQDGIWDIYLGIIILGLALSTIGTLFGLPSIISMLIILPLVYSIGIAILILGKKKITVPRIGYVKFGSKRQRRKKELVIFLSIILIINLIIFLLSNFEIIDIKGLFLLNIIIIVMPLGIVAYLLDFKRLYIIAFLIGIGIYFTIELQDILGFPLSPILIFGCIGIIIVSWGLYYLINFLKKYPISNQNLE